MCYARQPRIELTTFMIFVLTYGYNSLDKRFLEDIFRNIVITYNIIYIGIEPIFIAGQENIKSLIISLCIKADKNFVRLKIESSFDFGVMLFR